MKRTTIMVPDALDAQLRLEASRRGLSIAEITRQALEEHLAPHSRPGPLSFFAIGSGGNPDDRVSERVDEFVAKAIRRKHRL